MADLNTEYIRDGKLFSKGEQPNAGSLNLTNVIIIIIISLTPIELFSL
jgi:hypothetical protein